MTLDFGVSLENRKVNATNQTVRQTRMPYTFGKLGGCSAQIKAGGAQTISARILAELLKKASYSRDLAILISYCANKPD